MTTLNEPAARTPSLVAHWDLPVAGQRGTVERTAMALAGADCSNRLG